MFLKSMLRGILEDDFTNFLIDYAIYVQKNKF